MSQGNTLFVNPPLRPGLDLGVFRVLAEHRSLEKDACGDFFAFRLHGPKRLVAVIGDACGHGQVAANILPGVLRRLETAEGGVERPGHLLSYLNRGLAAELSSDQFITLAAFELDAQARTLTVANAGHVPAFLRRASGQVQIVGHASGPPLGIMEEASYSDETFRIDSGDVLVMMTDGVLEAVETNLTDMPTLAALVGQGLGSSGAVHGRLLAQLAARLERGMQDDMTLISFELLPGVRKTTLVGMRAMV